MTNTKTIGKSVSRVDAVGKVTGETLYPGDLIRDDMLFMKILFSDRPHARVRAIDTNAARALQGVRGVFTAADVPVNEYGLIIPDQPVLCGPGSNKEDADIVRTTMDMVALVVAESDAIAARAVELIEVDYQDLPAVFDPFAAMKDSAPRLHRNNPHNILMHYKVRRGDMEQGWANSDVIIEDTYTTTWQEHAYLQPEAGLAYIDEEGRITVEVAGQWPHEDQEQIYHALGLTENDVRVIYPAIGGAFGGREDMSVQIVLALAVWKLRQPVKIVWSREESMRYHHKRHPITVISKLGAKNDGTLTAAEVTIVGDTGAYAYTTTKVMGNSTLLCIGPYHIPNVHVDTYGVYTNGIPTGAFRGFGGPQASLAAEAQMSKLAEALGIDQVALRMKNVLHDGDLTHVGTPLPEGVTMDRVTRTCALESGWTQQGGVWNAPAAPSASAPHKRRGIGFASGYKNVGFSFGFPEQSHAIIELHGESEIAQVVVRHGGAEVGQGAHTVMAQMAAEATGVPLSKVRGVMSDTATSGNPGSASASRLTFMSGNAIRGASELALEKWRNEERPAIGEFVYRPPKTTPFHPETGRSEPNYAYGYVAESVDLEVDIETGEITILDVVCANDVGRAINPQLVQGQIEGAVVQAYGYAVMEHFQMQDGHVTTPYFSNYLIPTVLDVPKQVQSVILEYPDPIGPWGARGMGEMPYLPFAPAVVSAVYNATGIWFNELPLYPERLVKAFRAAGLGVE